MEKGLATAVVCISVVDREIYGGQHVGKVLQMLQQIRFAFGF